MYGIVGAATSCYGRIVEGLQSLDWTLKSGVDGLGVVMTVPERQVSRVAAPVGVLEMDEYHFVLSLVGICLVRVGRA